MIDPDRAKGWDLKVGFQFGEDSYVARLRKGRIKIARAPIEDCDLVFEGEPTAFAALVYGGAPHDVMRIRGDARLVDRFRNLFVLPPKVSLGDG